MARASTAFRDLRALRYNPPGHAKEGARRTAFQSAWSNASSSWPRRRSVNTRSPDGPLCPCCPPLPVLTCSVCGQRRPCGISRLTGLPWRPPCQGLTARCSGCGQVRPAGSGTLTEPFCRG